jgi:hypothetical protein
MLALAIALQSEELPGDDLRAEDAWRRRWWT